MGFIPRPVGQGGLEDAFWFAMAPITTIPMGIYATAAFITDDYRYGRPDWKANVRNAGIWGAIAQGVWAWNAYFHPGKYSYMSGTGAAKLAGHLAAHSGVLLPALAAASAVGWAATGHLHGAVPPGTASGFGMPMASTTGGSVDNPLGFTWGSLSTWADNMIPGFLR